jgi:hypothetical protein
MFLLELVNNTKEPILVKVLSDDFDFEPYVLIMAALSLIAAVIIPFAQKKYEEIRTKRSFQFYFRKQLGLILNLLESEQIEYIKPGIKDAPEKEFIAPVEFSRRLELDVQQHKEAGQPKTIFVLLMNLQKMMHFSYKLRLAISHINFEKLTERTLEHGRELSKKELQKTYGILLIYESFVSISMFHEKFGEMKSIKRDIEGDFWRGLKLEKDFLEKQTVLNDDLQHLNNNEKSIIEITEMIRVVDKKTKEYFEYKPISKRNMKKGEKWLQAD